MLVFYRLFELSWFNVNSDSNTYYFIVSSNMCPCSLMALHNYQLGWSNETNDVFIIFTNDYFNYILFSLHYYLK